jgi:hypothetical protein
MKTASSALQAWMMLLAIDPISGAEPGVTLKHNAVTPRNNPALPSEDRYVAST